MPEQAILINVILDRSGSLEQVRTIIREREGRGDWTFGYLGTAPERWAAETGMSAGSSVAFCAAEPQASFRVASEATRRLRARRRASTKTFFAKDKRGKAKTNKRDRS